MSVSPGEIKQIKQIMHAVLEERDNALDVPKKQHYKHHEYLEERITSKEKELADHLFVSSVRETRALIGATSTKIFVTAACATVLGFFGWLFEMFGWVAEFIGVGKVS